jgi:tetratricopeptide (TPR) repeat protein
MPEPQEYKPTLFDRHGASAADILRVLPYCLISTLLVGGAVSFFNGFTVWTFLFAVGAGAFTAWFGLGLSAGAGNAYKRLMMDGSTTPYVEQYSYQQALVMQGRIDDALESFEAVIAEKPDGIDVRIKAAELYDREKKNHVRAAELFRDAQRIPSIGVGQFVYTTNRLVDLYTGPLNEPGRALVELRKLIQRCPGSPAAEHARDALATLKKRLATSD